MDVHPFYSCVRRLSPIATPEIWDQDPTLKHSPIVADNEQPPLDDLLSNFALGPAWARGEEKEKQSSGNKAGGRKGGAQRDFKGGDRHGGGKFQKGNREGGKFQKGKRPHRKGDRFQDKRDQTPPATGVRVTILPDTEAVHLIVKEIQQVARVYSLFDIASTLLSKRERCRAIFDMKEDMDPMFYCESDDSLFLTREDAQAHLWHSDLRKQHLDEETVKVDPPSGNFQAVAKCGLSGKWLGPPNFHTYQTELHRLHRERFSNMPFEAYASKVQTERGEEAVNAWLETMTLKTRWRAKSETDDDKWIDDITQAKHLLGTLAFDEAFQATHQAELPAATGHQLSAMLRVSLKLAFNHARKHAAMVIPALCKVLEAEHLPVFKRRGKLYTGPVRPNPLPKDATLASRPGEMVAWIRAHGSDAKLEGLWKAVLPEGSTAPPAEYAADLFWLLQQGHIQLYMDDTLVVMEEREKPSPAKRKVEAESSIEEAEAQPSEETTVSEESEPKDSAGALESEDSSTQK